MKCINYNHFMTIPYISRRTLRPNSKVQVDKRVHILSVQKHSEGMLAGVIPEIATIPVANDGNRRFVVENQTNPASSPFRTLVVRQVLSGRRVEKLKAFYKESFYRHAGLKILKDSNFSTGDSDVMVQAANLYSVKNLIEKALAVEEIQAHFRVLLTEELSKALANLPSGAVDSLGAAKARGASYARTEWGKPENLTLQQAAAYCGRSDRVVNEARIKGEYYALLLEGKSRGYRYPLWQFDADTDRLAKILALLNTVDASCWVKHNFLLRPNTLLGGRSPREIILDQATDLSQLIKVTNNRFDGDQGAS